LVATGGASVLASRTIKRILDCDNVRPTKLMFKRRFHFLAIFSMKMETSSNQSRLSQMHQIVNRN
jgi:hypothetical protein